MALFRQENQKLKELVTGGASAATAGSSAAPADAEAAEAKEEPVKEESPAVRPKMEVSTPQKVGEIMPHNELLLSVFYVYSYLHMFRKSAVAELLKKCLFRFLE